MGNPTKTRQDDQDNDGIADDKQRQARVNPELDEGGDTGADGESHVQSNPIIINR